MLPRHPQRSERRKHVDRGDPNGVSRQRCRLRRSLSRGSWAQAPPEDNEAPGKCHRGRDSVEKEADREGWLRVDAEPAEEGDKEGLADAEPVQCERDHMHEEKQWPEDDKNEGRELNANRLPAHPDRHHPAELDQDGDAKDKRKRTECRAVLMQSGVQAPKRSLEPQASAERENALLELPARRRREEQDS